VIDKIEKIVTEEKDGDGLLNFFHPMPKQLEDTTSPSSSSDKPQPMIEGFDCWYDWRCENWSTKWDVNEFYGVDRQPVHKNDPDRSTISFGFSSAWAPPIGAYEKFIISSSEKKQDVSIKAYYYEGGCDFAGCWDDGNDECIAPSDYKSDDEYWNDGLGYDLDEMFNFRESMAEYEAEQEAEKEDVHEYVKGQAMNIGEEA
jgi:hypothetical protein